MEMGVSGTGHRPLGLAAMSPVQHVRRVRHWPRTGQGTLGAAAARLLAAATLCVSTALAASGCSSVGVASGAAAAAASGIVTANPAVGIGVGIAVQAATDVAVNRFMKNMHADQQENIAETVGRLQVGGNDTWRVKHTLPIENGHGQVRVLRAFSTVLAQCREFAFSVQEGDAADAPEQWYTAAACQERDKWKWASAEPAGINGDRYSDVSAALDADFMTRMESRADQMAELSPWITGCYSESSLVIFAPSSDTPAASPALVSEKPIMGC